MATIKDTSATSALNEDQYINKLYDNVIEKQKALLNENQNAASSELDALKESVQQQTNTNLGRVNVEAERAQQAYKAPNVSSSAKQQIALAMDNQKKNNANAVKTVQNDADAEIERQRKLLGEQYAAQIKKAQADNDMVRAQQLYEAAKQEDARLTALKQTAAISLAAAGDNSLLDSILAGDAVTRDTQSQTWDEVTKNEESINRIYDSAIESARQDAQMAKNEVISKIEAAQAAETASTDRNLTQAYVNALKNSKNYNEVQGAYGLGSGNMAQQQLARALGLTGTLTDLRNVLADNTAARGQQQFATAEAARDAIANAVAKNEESRANALYAAAEEEEQNLIEQQQAMGNALAEQGDYSVLGKLYGLTQDQIDRLQGTGAYAPKEETKGSGGGGGGEGSGKTTLSSALEEYYGKPSEIGKDIDMTEEEAEELFERLDAARELDAQIAEENAFKQAIVQGNKAAAVAQKKTTPTTSTTKKTDDTVDAVSGAAPKAVTTNVAKNATANAVKASASNVEAVKKALLAQQAEEEKAMKQAIVQGNKAAATAKKQTAQKTTATTNVAKKATENSVKASASNVSAIKKLLLALK